MNKSVGLKQPLERQKVRLIWHLRFAPPECKRSDTKPRGTRRPVSAASQFVWMFNSGEGLMTACVSGAAQTMWSCEHKRAPEWHQRNSLHPDSHDTPQQKAPFKAQLWQFENKMLRIILWAAYSSFYTTPTLCQPWWWFKATRAFWICWKLLRQLTNHFHKVRIFDDI